MVNQSGVSVVFFCMILVHTVAFDGVAVPSLRYGVCAVFGRQAAAVDYRVWQGFLTANSQTV